ncbi:CHAT domain-containing protein [Actinoallomurus vinaceus]|uniref:CHAT domain-containing protein n=1 Tax=Actinoallomurus vinaceus TaxID=1080074 RepID=A0ABP8UUL8_9ACTN
MLKRRRREKWISDAADILYGGAGGSDPAAVDHAIGLVRRAGLAGTGARPDVTVLLMTALMTRHRRTGSVGDLDEAIDAGRATAGALPPGDLDRLVVSALVAAGLQARHTVTGAAADIDEAISIGREVTDAYPDDMTGRAGSLANLSMSLLARFERAKDPADADDAVATGRRALDAAEQDDPDTEGVLSALGNALNARYRSTRSAADLDEAIGIHTLLVEQTGPGHPGRCQYLSNLGNALHSRFADTRDPADLDQAVDAGREAVALTPALHPNRAIHLRNLGNALETRVEQTATAGEIPADQDELIAVRRAALSVTPPGHPDRARALARLGFALWPRIEVSYSAPDIREAIETCREAALAYRPGDFDHGRLLGTLAGALHAGYQRTGDPALLTEAVDTGRAAVAEIPAGSPVRPLFMSVLAEALRARGWRDGALADLDDAITIGRETARDAAEGPVAQVVLGNLGAALTQRYALQEGEDDLEEAVTVLRTGAAATGINGPIALSNLGCMLVARWERAGGNLALTDMSDLEEGLLACRTALAAVPEDHPAHAACLRRLSNVLQVWSRRAIDMGFPATLEDLDEAVDVSRAAVAALPGDHPARTDALTELARALRNRFERTGERADADGAVSAARDALDALPADHADRCSSLHDLSRFQYERFERFGDPADVSAAIDGWREAVTLRAAPPATRLYAAHCWGHAAASWDGRWALAADGYARAVELLPLAAWRGLSQGDREYRLYESRGVGGDAAACAIAAGRPERALELLEQARGVIWSQLLDARIDLSALRAADPGLAGALDEARAAMDAPHADQRRAAAQRWDELVTRVRELPGFAGFLRSSSVAGLRAAADGGPVVILNASQWRCDALVVRGEGVTAVPLKGLVWEQAWRQAFRYLDAAEKLEDPSLSLADRSDAESELSDVLGWLWDAIAEPVLAKLGYLADVADGKRWPRIWWCPCGPLTLLPIHAAGYHGAGRPSILNKVISSYTPTLRALIRARATPAEARPARLLVVAMPQTPGDVDLPFARQERTGLVARFPDDRHTLLEGPTATRDAVRDALASHRWAHFSCHGGQDPLNPSAAGIVVHDGPVSLPDLAGGGSQGMSRGGEWAFLSACQTGTGGLRVPDEVMTLMSAMFYTGWRHVIGTLWSVSDAAAAAVTDVVYDQLASDGRLLADGAAEALHHAVRKMRGRWPSRPSLWAPFVHAGP